MDSAAATGRQSPTNRWSFLDSVLSNQTISMMESLDGLGYITTGMSFLAVSIVMFARAWYVFVMGVGSR